MTTFEVKGVNYRAEKLNAIVQFSISCKLASVLPVLMPLITRFGAARTSGQQVDITDGTTLAPLTNALSQMPDEARDFVMATLLGAVYREQGPGWLPIWDRQRSQVADDIDMVTMAIIAWKVFEANLGSFTGAPALNSSAATGA